MLIASLTEFKVRNVLPVPEGPATEQVLDYQKVYMRLKILKSQMAEIQDETADLIDTLEKMRNKDKNKEEDNG